MNKGLLAWRDGFADYACLHGELQASTVQVYLRCLDIFMLFLERRRVNAIQRLGLADIDAFFVHQGARMSPHSLYVVRGALRHFLKWLYVEGELATDLSCNLPRPSRFSADRRPKYLPWAKVEELLAGIDRSTLAGKRDYAILTLLAFHGLRAGEVAKLREQDIDFKEGSFFLRCRKNGRCARLPLSPRAKEALEDYLRVRGSSPCAEVFLSNPPPPKGLAAGEIGVIAHAHLRRRFPSGLPFYGSHVFRHSFAKYLLDRGARLADLGLILGHRHLRSTLMYTRIAIGELREVADNYARLL
jgi:site-specific recombinase XerD